MSEATTISLVWWITAVELPVLAGLFWLIHHGRREQERMLQRIERDLQARLALLLDNLSSFKLEAARAFVTMSQLRDLEKRLSQHLLRLEDRVIHLGTRSAGVAEYRRVGLEAVAGGRREMAHDR
jgi:hypothetical protein